MKQLKTRKPEGQYDLRTGSIWLHEKSNRLYVLVGVSENCTNIDELHGDYVIYHSTGRVCRIYHRSVAEFLDGRFLLVEGVEEAHANSAHPTRPKDTDDDVIIPAG